MRMVSGRALLTVAGLALSIGVVAPSAAASTQAKSDSKEALPFSTTEHKAVETFYLECPGNAQQTTLEMDSCFSSKIAQVEAVKQKYISAILKELKSSASNDAADNGQKTLEAFEAENKVWDTLIDKASAASYQHSIGGTMRGMVSSSRKLALLETRIHDQWANWLQTMSSSQPALLPEPRFVSR